MFNCRRLLTGPLSVSRCVSGRFLTLTIVFTLREVCVVFCNMSALQKQLEYAISAANVFYCSGKLASKTAARMRLVIAVPLDIHRQPELDPLYSLNCWQKRSIKWQRRSRRIAAGCGNCRWVNFYEYQDAIDQALKRSHVGLSGSARLLKKEHCGATEGGRSAGWVDKGSPFQRPLPLYTVQWNNGLFL